MRGVLPTFSFTMKFFQFILCAVIWAILCGCSQKKSSDIKFVSSNIERESSALVSEPMDAKEQQTAEEEVKEETAPIPEVQRPKTFVFDAETVLFKKTYWLHVEMAPDGTLTAKGLFYTDMYSEDEERTYTGAWRKGRILRGNARLTYYELSVDNRKWYITENLDYIWRGEDAYFDMCSNNIERAGKIVKTYEK